ncbi:MAG: MGMT family protein [Anaerolineae bacterium]
MPGFFEKVYEVVSQIPYGKVATYGQISMIIDGTPHGARTVGWALHALPEDSDIPWHRVINAQGRISTSCRQHDALWQRELLEEEGVVFDEADRVDLVKYQWQGPQPGRW